METGKIKEGPCNKNFKESKIGKKGITVTISEDCYITIGKPESKNTEVWVRNKDKLLVYPDWNSLVAALDESKAVYKMIVKEVQE